MIHSEFKQKKKPKAKNMNTDKNEGATIFDLQPQDKEKIGNLIRKVVELDSECKSTEQKAKEKQNKLKKQVTALKSQNTAIIKQHTKLRSKFQQSLKLLQNYQIKINQMDAFYNSQQRKQQQSQSSHDHDISHKKEHEQYAKQIQDEITELKQLILDLHQKEQEKENEKLSKITQIREKSDNQTIHKIPSNYLRASRRSMIYDANNPLFDEDEDNEILQELSPIKTPKSHHQPPKPHPYPDNINTKLSLSQLRKYTFPSSNASSSASLVPNVNKDNKSNSTTSRPVKVIDKMRLNQLLRIQSGKFKGNGCNNNQLSQTKLNKNNYDAMKQKNQNLMNTSSSLNNLKGMNENKGKLRRVQSEKGRITDMNLLRHDENMKRMRAHIIDSDDEIDRLSHYENMNLGINFPETDDDLSDQEDELLLIQHLNVVPRGSNS